MNSTPPHSHFVEVERGKGKNCKIEQEFCLWGARTQLPAGAGDGSPCQRQSCKLLDVKGHLPDGLWKSFKPRLTETSPAYHRCIHCLSNTVSAQIHTSALKQPYYCPCTVPLRAAAARSHAMCRLKAPQVTEREGEPKWVGAKKEHAGFRHRVWKNENFIRKLVYAKHSHTQLKGSTKFHHVSTVNCEKVISWMKI